VPPEACALLGKRKRERECGVLCSVPSAGEKAWLLSTHSADVAVLLLRVDGCVTDVWERDRG
jgi:hypothetical protein